MTGCHDSSQAPEAGIAADVHAMHEAQLQIVLPCPFAVCHQHTGHSMPYNGAWLQQAGIMNLHSFVNIAQSRATVLWKAKHAFLRHA